MSGSSFLLGASAPNYASMFLVLDDFEKRQGPKLSDTAIVAELKRRWAAKVKDAIVTVKHLTVWTDCSPTRLTAFVVTPADGALQLYLSGRPMRPDPDLPGVWGIDLVNQPRWSGEPLPLASGELRIAATLDGRPVRMRSTCSPSVDGEP